MFVELTKVNVYYFPTWKRKTGNMKELGGPKWKIFSFDVPKEKALCRYLTAVTEALGEKILSFFFFPAQNKYNREEMPGCYGNAEDLGTNFYGGAKCLTNKQTKSH